MDPTRVLTVSVMSVCAGLLALASCTRTTDRVLEPVGGGDASTTAPALGDGSVAPLGPLAEPRSPAPSSPSRAREPEAEPTEDFRLARSPEFGVGLRGSSEAQFAERRVIKTENGLPGGGGSSGTGGAAGNAGGPGRGRPVMASAPGGAAAL